MDVYKVPNSSNFIGPSKKDNTVWKNQFILNVLMPNQLVLFYYPNSYSKEILVLFRCKYVNGSTHTRVLHFAIFF